MKVRGQRKVRCEVKNKVFQVWSMCIFMKMKTNVGCNLYVHVFQFVNSNETLVLVCNYFHS
jgi:hypothetical protein